jgi:hypothetical protein
MAEIGATILAKSWCGIRIVTFRFRARRKLRAGAPKSMALTVTTDF